MLFKSCLCQKTEHAKVGQHLLMHVFNLDYTHLTLIHSLYILLYKCALIDWLIDTGPNVLISSTTKIKKKSQLIHHITHCEQIDKWQDITMLTVTDNIKNTSA